MYTKNPNTAQFAEGLKNLMANEQISTAMLSEWTGICEVAIRNYKSGRAYPQPGKLEKLEEVLRMTAEEITQVKPAPKPEPVYRSVHTDRQLRSWFSAGVRYLMQRERISLRDMSRLIGVKPDTIMTWTRDERSPKLANAMQIAEVFRMQVEDIVQIGQQAERSEE